MILGILTWEDCDGDELMKDQWSRSRFGWAKAEVSVNHVAFQVPVADSKQAIQKTGLESKQTEWEIQP